VSDLDRAFQRWFDDTESTRPGSGWWSGVAAVFLGAASLLGVLCFLFPDWLTTMEVRRLLPLAWARGILQIAITGAFLCGLLSIALRRRKVLGLTGLAGATLASVLGGSGVDFELSDRSTPSLGLDWFTLNLLLLAAIFVPLERLFPRRPEQSSFRAGWTTDGLYFLSSHLLVQVLTFLILAPAEAAFRAFEGAPWRTVVRDLPIAAQFFGAVFAADLSQYGVHRAFHALPRLWPFHALHHASESMDWLAGSRLHLVDVVITRAFVVLPLFVLGLDPRAVAAYLVFVSFHAVFIHANVRFDLSAIEPALVTPRFHHWHHANDPAAVNKNFAVHFPWIDRLFGTAYEPAGAWPSAYGIAGEKPPGDFGPQFLWPFRVRSERSA
jgi:lathosterol oxidase